MFRVQRLRSGTWNLPHPTHLPSGSPTRGEGLRSEVAASLREVGAMAAGAMQYRAVPATESAVGKREGVEPAVEGGKAKATATATATAQVVG
jgi:hypothetical protein